jgi:hypothetical protein
MDAASTPPHAKRLDLQALRKNTPNAAEKYLKKQVKTLRAESDEFFILGVRRDFEGLSKTLTDTLGNRSEFNNLI